MLLPSPSLLAVAAATTSISAGHADYAARIDGDRLVGQVKDQSHGGVRWRAPSAVVVRVGSRARMRVPRGASFLGRAGQTVWAIPQTERRGVPWLGWSTEGARRVRGSLRWTLAGVRGPGDVVLFQTGSFGDHRVLFSSRRGRPGTVTVRPGVHAHGTWAFTRRGSYRLTLRWDARSRSGRALSHTGTLRFRVG